MTKTRRKFYLFYAVGLFISVLPVLYSIILYFPIWADRGATTVISGLSLILILMATAPLIKLVKQAFKSPAAYLMWFVAFVIFFMLAEIADDVKVICFVGFISNLIGAIFFKLGERYRKTGEEKNEG